MTPLRKALVTAGFVGTAFAGGAMGATLIGTAGAAESTTTTAPAAAAAPSAPAFDPTRGGHVANGITETLLTGTTADKVRAAALAAVPGGTIQRVETDAEGDPYEAHMLDASGSPVTVKVGSDFTVTGTETGGPGHP